MEQNLPFHARFAGLDWSADIALQHFDAAALQGCNPIRISQQTDFRIQPPFQHVGRASVSKKGVRFDWEKQASFELSSDTNIGWIAGPEWMGTLPTAFFSSMTAITLAWRGILPLHASSVILHDKAWLVAGTAGAGKSTLTAELLEAGATLLADDLTPLSFTPGALAWRGKPAMRLHPSTAGLVEQTHVAKPAEDGSGKYLVWPTQRAADKGWPVGGILFLGRQLNEQISSAETAMAYGSILFRPKIMAALPQKAGLRLALLELARTIPMAVLAPVRRYDSDARHSRVEHTLTTIARLNNRASQST